VTPAAAASAGLAGVTTTAGINVDDALSFLDEGDSTSIASAPSSASAAPASFGPAPTAPTKNPATPEAKSALPSSAAQPKVKEQQQTQSDDSLLSDMLGDALLQTQMTTRRVHTHTGAAPVESQQQVQNQSASGSTSAVDDVLSEVEEMEKQADSGAVVSFLQVRSKAKT